MEDAEEYCIEEDADEEKKKARPIIKNAMDLQRLKLEKLMKNPDKQIIIPEPPREKDFMQTVPTFVRNVMGSSAGAGSGEFHVYRHLRRKEYARQKFIQAKSIREQLDDEYRQKLEQNKAEADAKTAKKRAKRMKKKQKLMEKGKRRKAENGNDQTKTEESSGDEKSDEEEKEDEKVVNDKDTMAYDQKEDHSSEKGTMGNDQAENNECKDAETCKKDNNGKVNTVENDPKSVFDSQGEPQSEVLRPDEVTRGENNPND